PGLSCSTPLVARACAGRGGGLSRLDPDPRGTLREGRDKRTKGVERGTEDSTAPHPGGGKPPGHPPADERAARPGGVGLVDDTVLARLSERVPQEASALPTGAARCSRRGAHAGVGARAEPVLPGAIEGPR